MRDVQSGMRDVQREKEQLVKHNTAHMELVTILTSYSHFANNQTAYY